MATTEKTPKIYEAISNVMKDVGIVGKNDSNDFDHYKYRGIDAVMNALNPAMIKNKVFVAPNVIDAKREERAGKNGTVMMYSVLTVEYTFYTEDGSNIKCTVIGEAMDRSDKSTNKAMSAAYKYACFQTFCIPTEEMQDADAESPEIGKKVQTSNIESSETSKKAQASNKGKKSDDQLNQEMIDSVDKRLLPTSNNVMTQEQYNFLMSEIKRTDAMADAVEYAKKAAHTDDLTKIPCSVCLVLIKGLLKRETKTA